MRNVVESKQRCLTGRHFDPRNARRCEAHPKDLLHLRLPMPKKCVQHGVQWTRVRNDQYVFEIAGGAICECIAHTLKNVVKRLTAGSGIAPYTGACRVD